MTANWGTFGWLVVITFSGFFLFMAYQHIKYRTNKTDVVKGIASLVAAVVVIWLVTVIANDKPATYTCKYPGCSRSPYKNGYCSYHYAVMYNYANP